jgi:hypothetical protein
LYSTNGEGGVLLLHGHGRLGASMALLARAARRVGYATFSPSYPIAVTIDFVAPSARSAPSLPSGWGFRPRQQVKGICSFLMSCLDGERDLPVGFRLPVCLMRHKRA